MNRDFLLASACEQARAIARGELDAQQLLAAQYAAIEQRNPALHAFIAVADQPLRSDGSAAASELAGSTFAVKDSGGNVASWLA